MFQVFALHYQNRKIRMNLLAIAKVEGMLRWWYGDKDTLDQARRPLIDACNAAFWPTDRIFTRMGSWLP